MKLVRTEKEYTGEDLEQKDCLYQQTGLVLLTGSNKQAFFYFRQDSVLIPVEQAYIGKNFTRLSMPSKRALSVNGRKFQWGLPDNSDSTIQLFAALKKMEISKKWELNNTSKWLLGKTGVSGVYDSLAGTIGSALRANISGRILQCIYFDGVRNLPMLGSSDDYVYLRRTLGLTPILHTDEDSNLESSKTEESQPQPPQNEEPKLEPLEMEMPTPEPPKKEEPTPEPLKKEVPTPESPKREEPKPEPPKKEISKPEQPKKEARKPEPSKKEESRARPAAPPQTAPAAAKKTQTVTKHDFTELLDCDKRRCRLESYNETILHDIQRGHWELFDSKEAAAKYKNDHLVARDPRRDIKKGIVGIDFGTSSTVVVTQNETENIIPFRIGTVRLNSAIRESDFENPTMIECTDLDIFLQAYEARPGRPDTSCEDFFVSYDACNDFTSCPPSDFYAYFGGLKQWSNREKPDVLIEDKRKHCYTLSATSSRENQTFNPIELYAYYIGMYINNMENGIYLKYLMSFPVGYSKETREFIRSSFETGLKKSLPPTVLADEDCMKQFSVKLGISEPAAYAVAALELRGLCPENERECYRYGIFDFGGGTTDFDFGVWRGASEDEYDNEGCDYVLECFGAASDVTLGGENILELMAYHVFRTNEEMVREKRLECTFPTGVPETLQSRMLTSNAREAMRNMSLLKEALRPLWHQEPGWPEKYQHEGSNTDENAPEYLELSLYDVNGEQQPNCRFQLSTEELILLIKERIRKGIGAFFRCMEQSAHLGPNATDDKFYVFLAGNASKSIFVRELFDEAIEENRDLFKSRYPKAGDDYIELIEPMSEQRNDEQYTPNGKTGVAYGLVMSRDGSSIKIIKEYEADVAKETRFQYYLGQSRRKKFICRLSPTQTEYGQWVKFQGAARETIRIYYTKDPHGDINPQAEGGSSGMDIGDTPYKEVEIVPEAGKYLFIRTVRPTEIEYAVASSADAIQDQLTMVFD